MLPSEHEGNRSSSGPGAHAPAGLDQDPHRIALCAPGWPGAIGWATDMQLRVVTGDRGLLWIRVDFAAIKLSRAAALLIVQGMKLQELFPSELCTDGKPLQLRDPLLLKATPPNPLEVSPMLRGVVLGLVVHSTGFSEDEVRGALVASVLHP